MKNYEEMWREFVEEIETTDNSVLLERKEQLQEIGPWAPDWMGGKNWWEDQYNRIVNAASGQPGEAPQAPPEEPRQGPAPEEPAQTPEVAPDVAAAGGGTPDVAFIAQKLRPVLDATLQVFLNNYSKRGLEFVLDALIDTNTALDEKNWDQISQSVRAKNSNKMREDIREFVNSIIQKLPQILQSAGVTAPVNESIRRKIVVESLRRGIKKTLLK